MSTDKTSTLSRRSFLQRSSLLAGSASLATEAATGHAFGTTRSNANREIPRRVLGKTDVPITALSIGTAPIGFSKHYSVQEIGDIINAALDEGVTTIDTARHYNKAEEGVALGIGSRRKDVFLATKVWADTVEVAEKSLAQSLKLLKTDCVDLLYYHSLGNREVDGAMDPDGVFTWLLKQKQAGKTRFVGLSGHHLPERFVPFLDSGEVDALLVLLNFVDRYTYNFEERVLPTARKHDVGIVAMKVFGGPRGGFRSYGGPKAPPLVGGKFVELAIRYALGLPGVAAVNLGVHDVEQVRKNVEVVKNYRPLDADETALLEKSGRELAAEWGPHFGAVTE